MDSIVTTDFQSVLTDENGSSYLESSAHIALISGRHVVTALSGIEQHQICFITNSKLLVISPVTTQDNHHISPREIALYSPWCNNIAGIIFYGCWFLDTLKTILVCHKTIERKYGGRYMDAKTGQIAETLQPSYFLSGFTISSGQHHIRIVKFVILCLSALRNMGEWGPDYIWDYAVWQYGVNII